jgi:hypothetical protein
VGAACIHLALVICGAARFVPFSQRHAFGRTIEVYREYTGANNGYGFYAPAVASEWSTTFEVCGGKPPRCFEAREEPANREVGLLLSTIDGMYMEDDLRDLVAASWAGVEFGRYPHAAIVVVKPRVFLIPSMEQFRRGLKPRWRTAYAYAFTRRDVPRH